MNNLDWIKISIYLAVFLIAIPFQPFTYLIWLVLIPFVLVGGFRKTKSTIAATKINNQDKLTKFGLGTILGLIIFLIVGGFIVGMLI